jgi:hypothetical protein
MFTILRFQDPVTRTSASTYSLAGESLRKAALVEIPAISGSAYEQRGPPVAVTAAQSALTFAEMSLEASTAHPFKGTGKPNGFSESFAPWKRR